MRRASSEAAAASLDKKTNTGVLRVKVMLLALFTSVLKSSAAPGSLFNGQVRQWETSHFICQIAFILPENTCSLFYRRNEPWTNWDHVT